MDSTTYGWRRPLSRFSAMASVNHKTGLAVVVPVSDNRSQPQGVGTHDAYYSPRRLNTQSMNRSTSHQFHGTHSARRLPNGSSSWQHSNGAASVKQAHDIPSSRLPSDSVGKLRHNPTDMQKSDGVNPCQPKGKIDRPNGAVRGRPRLLGVEEALPYSPFSSVVPFSSGTLQSQPNQYNMLTFQTSYQSQVQTSLALGHSFLPYPSRMGFETH